MNVHLILLAWHSRRMERAALKRDWPTVTHHVASCRRHVAVLLDRQRTRSSPTVD